MWLRASTLLLVLLLCGSGAAGQDAPRLIPYKTVRGWGYADERGRLRLPPRFADARLFVNGRAAVSVATPGGPVQCVIDAAGRYIIPPAWHWSGHLFPGFDGAELNVQDNAGRWGYADTAGRLLIPFAYDSPMHARGHYFAQFQRTHRGRPPTLIAARRGRYGLIDSAGRVQVPFEYDLMKRPNDYHNSTAAHWLLVSTAGLWGAVDTAGRPILPIRYPKLNVYQATPGLVKIFDGSRWGCADSAGRLVIPVAYDKVELESNYGTAPPYFNLIEDNLWGWADSTGRIRIEPCSASEIWQNGRYFTGTTLGKPHRPFLMDSTGRTVVPPRYWGIRTSGDTVWVMKKGEDSAGSYYVHDEARYDVQRGRIVGAWKRRAVAPPEIVYPEASPIIEIARHRYWGEDVYYSRSEGHERGADVLLDGVPWHVQSRLYSGVTRSAPLTVVARDTGRAVFYALVDSAGRARISPQTRWAISDVGSWAENWFCARDSTGQYFALDTALRPLLGPVPEPVVQRIVWKEKPYWIVRNSARPVPDRPTRAYDWEPPCVAVYDHRGLRVPALEPHCLVKWQHATETYLPAGERNLLRVEDDQKRIGFFHPDGTAPYPAVNFLLCDAKAFSPRVFFGYKKDQRYATVVDGKGRPYAPDAKIVKAERAYESSEKSGSNTASDPSLLDVQYLVDGTDPDWSKRVYSHFYLGLDGRVYADADALRSK